MSYKIKYRSFGEEKRMPKDTGRRKAVAAAVLVLALVFGAMSVKLKGLFWVREYLLPGDPAVTAAALDGMAEDLRNGESLKDAIVAFCREIMAHGQSVS